MNTEQRATILHFLELLDYRDLVILKGLLLTLKEINTMAPAQKTASRTQPLPEIAAAKEELFTDDPARHYPRITTTVRMIWGGWTLQVTFADMSREQVERELLRYEAADYEPCVSPDRPDHSDVQVEDPDLPTKQYPPVEPAVSRYASREAAARRPTVPGATDKQRAFLQQLGSSRADDPRLTIKEASDLIAQYTGR